MGPAHQPGFEYSSRGTVWGGGSQKVRCGAPNGWLNEWQPMPHRENVVDSFWSAFESTLSCCCCSQCFVLGMFGLGCSAQHFSSKNKKGITQTVLLPGGTRPSLRNPWHLRSSPVPSAIAESLCRPQCHPGWGQRIVFVHQGRLVGAPGMEGPSLGQCREWVSCNGIQDTGGRGGGIPCGGKYESTNSGATKSVPLVKNERTNYVWFPIIAHEKQWALAVITCTNPENTEQIAYKILLPSAVHLEERLTVSQSVPEPASRQSQIHTVWVFCQWQMRRQAAGRPIVTIQVVAEWQGSNPSLPTFAPPAAAARKVGRTLRTDACTSGFGRVTIGPLAVLSAPCVPTACSLLSKNF